jgi:geranylgeranyl reductase family protein
MNTYDVGIVGAGPAGAYLGFLLSRSGAKVLILDKEMFPRDKVCGGGLSNKTLELIDFDLSPVVQRRITGAFLTFQNVHTVVKDLGSRSGVTTLRRDFDHFLVTHAVDAGAEFWAGSCFLGVEHRQGILDVTTSTKRFQAKYLVGADGVFSSVRKAAFPAKLVTYAPSVEALVYVDDRAMRNFDERVLFDFGGVSRGYGWIFPKLDHLNVGVYSVFPNRRIKSEFLAFMGRYATLASPKKAEFLGSCIPLRNTRRQFQDRNVWLVGDAAGLAESFYGEGIYFALKSATIAAEALMRSFKDVSSGLYTEMILKDLMPDLRYSEVNAKLFFSFPRFGYYSMVRNEHVNRYFAELIAGDFGHRECFYKTALSLPYWLFSKKLPYEYRHESGSSCV